MANMTTLQILQGIKTWVTTKLNLKQDVINDLANIRSGAQAGSTAVQPAELSAYFNDASYDNNTHRINFYHGQTVVAYVDASPFIIDGMVDDVRIENGYLVIDFNTASGKQDISIPLTDIFNPNNYYNKTQTDGLLAQKQDVIQDLADIRSGASAGSTAVQPSTLNDAVKNVVAESGVYDVSANNDNTKFESLSALLSSANLNTLIPTDIRKGGMSIKFVLSSDNKYVQFRLMADAFTTDVTQWQGVDEDIIAGSNNLTKSNAVAKAMMEAATNNFYLENVVLEGDGQTLSPINTLNGYYFNNEFREHDTVKTYIYDLSNISATKIITMAPFGVAANNKILLFTKEYSLIGGLPYIGSYVDKVINSNNFLVGFTSGDAVVIKGFDVFHDSFEISNDARLRETSLRVLGHDKTLFGVDNLFDSAANGIVFNAYVNPANGRIRSNTTTNVSDFIEVETGELYSYNADIPSTGQSEPSMRFIAGYDSSKQIIPNAFSPSEYVKSVIIPNNVKYVRICYPNTAKTVLFNKGNQADISLYMEWLKAPNYSNLLNTNDSGMEPGRYISPSSGNTGSNPDYDTSHYISVVSGKTYTFSDSLNNPMRLIAAYNVNKELMPNAISDERVSTIIIPANVCFVRFCYKNDGKNPVFVEGLSTSCVDYAVKDKTIDDSVLNYNSISKCLMFKDYSQMITGDLSSGEQLELDANNIKTNKRLSFSAKITSFTSISIGHGLTQYASNYIVIDGTNIYAHKLVSEDIIQSTTPHGLSITNTIGVLLNIGEDDICHCSLFSNGERFDVNIPNWLGSNGNVFAKADNALLTDCYLSWTCDGYKADTHIYGDSYLGITSSSRWAYYLIQDGFGKNVLLDGYGGKGSDAGVKTLLMNIQHSRPKYIVWALGMNNPDGRGETPEEINSVWMDAVNKLLMICEQFNITPIFVKIPNVVVPQNVGIYYHNLKNEWIENSGYRYVDIPLAVGAQNDGTWYSGMLSSDGVHPTAKGAIAIYNQFIASIPELMI